MNLIRSGRLLPLRESFQGIDGEPTETAQHA